MTDIEPMITPIGNRTEAEERTRHLEVTARLKQAYREMRENVAARHAEMIQIKQQLQDQVRDLDHVDKANLRQAAEMASRVGEMQDYSPLQYQVLSMLYPCKRRILGDRNQSINPLSSSHAESIRDVLSDSICVYMRKSYRSTFQITQLAQSILRNPDLEPIERHGEEPTFNAFRKKSDELAFIAEEMRAFHDSEFQSLAIICRTQAEADELYEFLNPLGSVSLLNSPSKSVPSGILITTAYLAKELEFDKVIIPFCTISQYSQPIDRHVLYVAVTRAMHSVVITYVGTISNFLESVSQAAPTRLNEEDIA